MALSVAVPIRLDISSLVKEIFIKPSGSVPSLSSSKRRISASLSLTVFCARSVMVLEYSPNSQEIF